MGLTVAPCPATLGAVVTGVALARLTDAEWGQLVEAFHSYGVLIFPDQHLTNDEQVEFSLRLGPLEAVGGRTPGARPEISRISNLNADGSVNRDETTASMRMVIGNMDWHADSSFRDPPAMASILSCHVAAPAGGETEFADMRAAYDALDPATRDRLEGRLVSHSYLYSQGKVGGLEATFTPEQRANMGPVQHPVLRVHPATGRRSLFIGRHAFALSGMPDAEAQTLLESLLAWACQAPRVYTHRWSEGDVVMWDNRCVLHRARPWDYQHPRVMWHTRVAGLAA